MLKKIFFLSTFFLFAQISFGQAYSTIPGCPYNFTKYLHVGDTDKEVLLIQRILNSDRRTLVAEHGVGAKGQETNYFGPATREALKRFQALFIEYINIADGVFNERTRTVMQKICSGGIENISVSNTHTQTNAIVYGLQVVLRKNTQSISAGAETRLLVTFNNQVNDFSSEMISIDGGVVKEISKMSKNEYLVIVIASEDSKMISAQIESEKIVDASGKTNELASNEIEIKVNPSLTQTLTDTVSGIDENLGRILNNIISPNNQTTSIPASYGPNNSSQAGSSGLSPYSGNQQEKNQQNTFSQMLTGMLGGLSQGASGGSKSNIPGLDGVGGSGRGDIEPYRDPSSALASYGPIVIPANTPESCKKNYGFVVTGSCPTKDLEGKIHPLVAKAGMSACAANGGKPVKVTSVLRSKSCNSAVGGVPTSQHLTGASVDIPPTPSLVSRVFEATGLVRFDEGNHWHYYVPK